jgi:hypothetical protein
MSTDLFAAAIALMSAAAGPEASGAAMQRDDGNWWRLCREADERTRKQKPVPMRARRAPGALVDALVFSLRRGVGELTKPDTQRRLSALSEDQLQAVCQRVQAFQSNIAEPWSADDADLLISVWGKFHGR